MQDENTKKTKKKRRNEGEKKEMEWNEQEEEKQEKQREAVEDEDQTGGRPARCHAYLVQFAAMHGAQGFCTEPVTSRSQSCFSIVIPKSNRLETFTSFKI